MTYDVLQNINFGDSLQVPHFGCFHSLKAHSNSSHYLSLIAAICVRTIALTELIQRVLDEPQKMIMKARQIGGEE